VANRFIQESECLYVKEKGLPGGESRGGGSELTRGRFRGGGGGSIESRGMMEIVAGRRRRGG
jgi:hypothetical protein